MGLRPLTKRSEILEAYRILSANLKRGAKPFRNQNVGWPGDSGHFTVYWQPKEHFWSMLETSTRGKWYWISFGTDQPPQPKSMSIVCEINPPFQGFYRMLAGSFVRDDEGEVYLSHSGKVGGGRRGIGKSAFLRYWRGENKETVVWPDGLRTEMILIGNIESPFLPSQIAHFVREVEYFKNAVTLGTWKSTALHWKDKFTPEFTGKKKGYVVGTIEARSNHGLVVNALARQLGEHKLKFANDKQRDMYVLAQNNRIRFLFEVKTDSAPTSIYQAIGQALFHTASYKPHPQPVLVMPGTPKRETLKVFRHLGIKLMTYAWKGNRPSFHGIDRLLN